MTAEHGPIWLIGCGAMGGALLSRWRATGSNVTVIDPAVAGALASPPEGTPAVIILAVKPQAWKVAVAPLKHVDALVISIMAGVTCAALGDELPQARIVRTIPNLASGLGEGVTALYDGNAFDQHGEASISADRQTATALMSAAGACLWLEREADFDAVTAVSGSGPAYVFAFIEAFAAAGVAAGLSAALSQELAMRTVTGAAALVAQPGVSPAALREAVSSPGGTTLAGLKVLQAELAPLLRATVAAAQSRSRELGDVG